MHYAFKSLCPDGTVVNAFDINEIANDVYQHNFGFRPKQVGHCACLRHP
jgi:tRNA (cytosine38-C5)-methyltransferase